MADTDLVLVERHGGTAVLTLNAPRRRNVLSAELVDAVGSAVDEIEADPESRCLVVTGAGPAFCAGAELSTLEAAADGGTFRAIWTYDTLAANGKSTLTASSPPPDSAATAVLTNSSRCCWRRPVTTATHSSYGSASVIGRQARSGRE